MSSDATDSATSQPSGTEWARWAAPWDGVSAKLEHAWRHFNLLGVNAQQFVRLAPITMETHAAPERGPNWLRIDASVRHPGTPISLMLGDFLHNLRCALDHSLTALDPKAGRRTNFPTSVTEAEFNNWAQGWRDAGGTEEVIQAIRQHQPFLAPLDKNPEDFVLRIVSRLNNADKHRLLNVTPIGISDEKPPNLKLTSNVRVVNYEWVLNPGPLNDHETALFAELAEPVDTPGISVGLEGTIPIAVSVDNYSDVVVLGAKLHEAVVKACHALRAEFLPGRPVGH